MPFDHTAYGPEVQQILSLDQNGARLMPLIASGCSSIEAQALLKTKQPGALFPRSQSPAGAMAGLWLYFSCFEEAHEIAQKLSTQEGSLWHAILHRQEPDSGNSAYWFRHAGEHPFFKSLVKEAVGIIARHPKAEFRPSVKWDAFGFILFCERAREQPGSDSLAAALEIQRAEWQLLFDYCARTKA
jgi:hypothetical protein